MIDAVSRALQIALPFDTPPPAIGPTQIFVAAPSAPTAPTTAPPTYPSEPPRLDALPVYFVRHRRARRYLLRVEPDGRLRVTIPRGGSRREAEAFARRHAAWVARQRAGLAPSRITSGQRADARRTAERELPDRLRELAAEHGVAGLTRVSVRNQRTRWGSCGRDGHICLNWRLVLMPAEVRDYVLIHELMHLRRMDHSPAYWRLVAAACPRYAAHRLWLRANGPSLR